LVCSTAFLTSVFSTSETMSKVGMVCSCVVNGLNLKTAVAPQRHREHRVKTTAFPDLLAHPMGGRYLGCKLLMFAFLCASVSLW
ncbi:MAG: hypothetical protein R8K20_08800, partial [Gallionellaceae bacterium]